MDYLSEEKIKFLSKSRNLFHQEDLNEIEGYIDEMDADALQKVLSIKFKKPISSILFTALLGIAGVDYVLSSRKGFKRFSKFITYVLLSTVASLTSSTFLVFLIMAPFFVWWLIDVITAPKKAKTANMEILREFAVSGTVPNQINIDGKAIKQIIKNLLNNKEFRASMKDLRRAAKELHNTFYPD